MPVPDEDSADRALVDAIVSHGDEAAFRVLYRRNAGALRALVRRWLEDDRDRVDDVLQETWMRAVQRFPRFEWRSSLRTWLISIAINCCREAVRVRPLQLVREDAAMLEDGRDPGQSDSRIDLESALARIAAGYRQVLILHDVHGLTHEEIASVLDIEVGTSKSQLSRARAALRKLLGPSITGPNDQDSAHA